MGKNVLIVLFVSVKPSEIPTFLFTVPSLPISTTAYSFYPFPNNLPPFPSTFNWSFSRIVIWDFPLFSGHCLTQCITGLVILISILLVIICYCIYTDRFISTALKINRQTWINNWNKPRVLPNKQPNPLPEPQQGPDSAVRPTRWTEVQRWRLLRRTCAWNNATEVSPSCPITPG